MITTIILSVTIVILSILKKRYSPKYDPYLMFMSGVSGDDGKYLLIVTLRYIAIWALCMYLLILIIDFNH
jgi:hypothetical protein